MPDVFDLAIGTIFDDRNIARDAVWRPRAGGDGFATRVIIKTPQDIVDIQGTRFDLDGVLIDVRFDPAWDISAGDTVFIADCGEVYKITALRTRDSSRLVQTCEAILQ